MTRPTIMTLRHTRLWLLAFLGFAVLHAGWALAAPYDGPPDEQQHAMRAAAVSHGEFLPQPGRIQIVPNSLARPACFPMHVEIPANCAPEPGGDQNWQPHFVSESLFNPVYYLVTGWPVGLWPSWPGIVAARVLTGMLMAALLASALTGACRWTRHRALLAGLVVAVTPMVAHLGGSINPNGVEIAAGAALFTALIAVVHENQDRTNRAAVALAGVSASILVTPRFSGLLWIAVIVVAVTIPSSWNRLRTLARERSVRAWGAVVVLAIIASAAWTVTAHVTDLQSGANGYTAAEIARTALLDMWPNVVNQMVGVMGWAETLQPRLIYVVWFAAAGLLLLGGFALGAARDRWRLILLTLGTFVPLLGMELLLVNQIGWFNQGRYFLPGAVGLPLFGAHVLARRGLTADQMRAITRLFAVILMPIQLVCLAYTMCRWQSGLHSLNPFKGSWLPPYGTVAPLLAGALGAIILVLVYWSASRSTGRRSVGLPRREPEQELTSVAR